MVMFPLYFAAFRLEKVAFYSGDGSDLPQALVSFHHSLCSTPRYFPAPARAWKCLSALANFDKCYIRLKIIQLHMDNLSKTEANTSLWVCYRRKTRLRLSKFLKHSVMDLVWKRTHRCYTNKNVPWWKKANCVVLKLIHLFAWYFNFLHTKTGYEINKLWIIPYQIAISMRDSHGFLHL